MSDPVGVPGGVTDYNPENVYSIYGLRLTSGLRHTTEEESQKGCEEGVLHGRGPKTFRGRDVSSPSMVYLQSGPLAGELSWESPITRHEDSNRTTLGGWGQCSPKEAG